MACRLSRGTFGYVLFLRKPYTSARIRYLEICRLSIVQYAGSLKKFSQILSLLVGKFVHLLAGSANLLTPQLANYSYANTSRIVRREALRAGPKLATVAKTVTMINHMIKPLIEKV